MDTSWCKDRMQKAIDFFENELAWLQIGRVTRGLVENISISTSYGSMPIGQLANITVPDTQTIKIESRDKSVLPAIEKAIYDLWTWLAPKNEWAWYIIVKVPALTWERRQQLAKQVHAMGEEIKARMRQVRHDEMKAIKHAFEQKELSEDEKKQQEDAIDDITKTYNKKVDDHIKNKEDDILK